MVEVKLIEVGSNDLFSQFVSLAAQERNPQAGENGNERLDNTIWAAAPPSIGNADSVFTMNEEHLPEHNFQMPGTPNTSLPRNWVANSRRFYMKSPPLKGG
jgi:hypothetical protein